jgi:transcriptional regulator with XRE-family HTH domain
LFAPSANISNMKKTLGSEIKRLRLQADFTLRKLADDLGISAAHLSDIEHDRRRPSSELIDRLVAKLRHAGATRETLERLDPRIDADTQSWVAETPSVGELLRHMRSTGEDPLDLLRMLREKAKDRDKKEGKE